MSVEGLGEQPAHGHGGGTDRQAEFGDFLRTRRSRLKPEDAGLPNLGHRRVPGLRREEVAQLAGVSVSYYTRLEQGKGGNVSAKVLDLIAWALKLTHAEQAHLTHLAQPKRHKGLPAARTPQVRASLRQLLDTVDGVPAYVLGRGTDLLVWNQMAAAVFGDWAEMPAQERNWARLVFLKPEYRRLFVEWEQQATEIVTFLRLEADRRPDDLRLSALVGELSVKSEGFGRLWAARGVERKSHGAMNLHHPLVGYLTLSYETFRPAAASDQALIMYHAEPGSPSSKALQLLASRRAGEARAGSSAHP